MKKSFTLIFILPFLFFSAPVFSKDPQIDLLTRKPVGKVHFPDVSVETLPNGMRIYLLEDHELPLFEMFAFIRGGSVEDPADRVGLASLLGTLLRTGGTKKRSVQEIDRFLEDRGAAVETGMAAEYGTAYLSGLSDDLRELVPLYFEILSSPRFDSAQLDLARVRRIEALRRLNDNPEKIAFREFPKLLYGNDSVWARTSDAKSLRAIDRADLFRFHGEFFHPDRMILAVAGDFKKSDLLSLIRKSTEGWPPATHPLPEIPPVKKEWSPGLYGIQKKGGQSTLVMGHFGEKRWNPDKFALILMNMMLGGDIFSSRLGEEVRSNRGLAYSVFSHFGLETDYGLFYAVAQTQTPATGEVIRLIQEEIKNFHQGKGFSEASLQFAKESILNEMAGEWEPRFNYVKERARLSFYGYPENYLEIYQKNLREVNLGQVEAAAKKYLFPDRLKILVVGDLDKMGDSLKSWGELHQIPLPTY